jgi:hypothetical protein
VDLVAAFLQARLQSALLYQNIGLTDANMDAMTHALVATLQAAREGGDRIYELMLLAQVNAELCTHTHTHSHSLSLFLSLSLTHSLSFSLTHTRSLSLSLSLSLSHTHTHTLSLSHTHTHTHTHKKTHTHTIIH